MVTLLNKWRMIPALSLWVLLVTGNHPILLEKKGKNVHPIHISTLEIVHNATDKALEITCKIFWDDFETALTKNNKNVRVDLISEKKLVDNNKLVSAYISNHLSLTIDDKPMTLSFVGFEKEDAVIYSYMEVASINSVKKVSVTNSIMHDMFDDQIEIIHVVVNGNRKSTKLEYPDKEAKFVF